MRVKATTTSKGTALVDRKQNLKEAAIMLMKSSELAATVQTFRLETNVLNPADPTYQRCET